MRIFDHRGRPRDRSPLYLVQTEAERFWQRDAFIEGLNIIGVRAAQATFVYLPHDLPVEHVICVKDESGLGAVTVRVY